MDFLTELEKRVLVLDGSMGALLQNRGLPAGMAPDIWMMENPDIIFNAHKEYADAGADILLTNTFGASHWRLKEYNQHGSIKAINARAVELARKAIGDRGFVAGDIGPSGETIVPTGTKTFDEAYEIFYEQAKILVELGVDLIVVETLFDAIELRVALSAVRAASSKIPVIAHATFNIDGVTDTGATAANIVAIAEGYHATGVGINCSTGPEPMVAIVEEMVKRSKLHVSVQPNAGLPTIQKGRTVFPMGPNELEPFIHQFLDKGVSVLGGCCGTTPEYIRKVRSIIDHRKFDFSSRRQQRIKNSNGTWVSSLSKAVRLGGSSPFVPIGERMNPSGRKALSQSLKEGSLKLLLEDAEVQIKAGGELLDLNVGVPLLNEPDLMKQAVLAVQNRFAIPLMIDSANTFALDEGAKVYYGRPLLNSINIEEEKLLEALPVMKRHGAAIVCMTTGVEVPVKSEDRLTNAIALAKHLIAEGFDESDFVFDCLGLVVSAMHEGSIQTLRTIEKIKGTFPRSSTTLGLSNVSFGLPNRSVVHTAFLTMAIEKGLDSAIMSVTDPVAKIFSQAAALWTRKDGATQRFMENYPTPVQWGTSKTGDAVSTKEVEKKSGPQKPAAYSTFNELEKRVFDAIVDGQKESALREIHEFTKLLNKENSHLAMNLFMNVMTPAIRYLGDLFGARIKFIPHLIAAADAMKAGVGILEPYLIQARKTSGESKGTVIFATVKGDIHDIGKNICILMLRNFGYEVIDLGRNVEPEVILQTAIEKKAKVVGLSALMTTTMMQMKVIIDEVKKRNLPFKVLIGGAVVTPEFAKEITADGFSTDVGTVVSEVERVIAILEAIE